MGVGAELVGQAAQAAVMHHDACVSDVELRNAAHRHGDQVEAVEPPGSPPPPPAIYTGAPDGAGKVAALPSAKVTAWPRGSRSPQHAGVVQSVDSVAKRVRGQL